MPKNSRYAIANWKMNPPTLSEAAGIYTKLRTKAAKLRKTHTVVCPPFLYVPSILKLKGGEHISVGAQTGRPEDAGSMTGEVSLSMLSHAGVSSVILGHSERRKMGETDEYISKQIDRALTLGLTPIVCVGEKIHDAEGKFLHELTAQMKATFAKVPNKQASKLIIAYEPVWAIGTGTPMPAQTIYEMTIFVKKVVSDLFGHDQGARIPVLYGGSVNAKNIEEIMKVGKCDGVLVGKESLNPISFAAIMEAVDTI